MMLVILLGISILVCLRENLSNLTGTWIFLGDDYILEREYPMMVITIYLEQTERISLVSTVKTGYFVGNGAGYADALDY